MIKFFLSLFLTMVWIYCLINLIYGFRDTGFAYNALFIFILVGYPCGLYLMIKNRLKYLRRIIFGLAIIPTFFLGSALLAGIISHIGSDPCTRDISLIESLKPFPTGPCIGYYDNGILRYEGQLVKGSYEGVWNYYNPEGNLESETNFKNNERDGIWTYFDNEGDVIKTERYIDGELIETN